MSSSSTKFDTDCALMLHMDGSDASTTFTDSSFNPQKTVTANGNAQIDTAQSKFSGASGLFDGTGDYLTVPDDNSFDLGAGAWTVDFWVRFNSTTGNQVFFDIQDGYNTTGVVINKSGAGGIDFLINAVAKGGSISPGFVINTWYHIAVVKDASGNVYFFKDGTNIASADTDATTITGTAGVKIGARNATDLNFNGWMDEFRIVKGTAVWTANFTPPTSAYSQVASAKPSKMMLMGIG